MAPFHPVAGDLPSEIPVFPLAGALLLPRGKLPLNIFEPRYLAVTEDALAERRMFGMIQPDPSAPATPCGPGLYRVGCLGRLSSFAETDDGRFLITLTGVVRFNLLDEHQMRKGYRRIAADYRPYLPDLEAAPASLAIPREALNTALRSYFAHRGFEANWDAVARIEDDILVVTLAMICPFEPAEKQALLEAPSDAERASTLLALLQIGAGGDSSTPPQVS